MSHWKQSGRSVVEVVRPVLCVAKSWITRTPNSDELVLGYSQLNEYLVTSRKYLSEITSVGCWDVFHESETIRTDKQLPVSGQVLIGNSVCSFPSSSSNSFPSLTSPSTSSHDGGYQPSTAAKTKPTNKLQTNEPESRLLRTDQTSGTDIHVYFPEQFEWSRYPDLRPLRPSVLWFAHNLHERRFVNADGTIHGKDDFIVINSAYAREVDPNFRHTIRLLVNLGVVERDFYQPQIKSYGYRFAAPMVRNATRRRIPLGDSTLAKRIRQHRKKNATTRTDRWLQSQLLKIGLSDINKDMLAIVAAASMSENGGQIDDKLDAYNFVLERISFGEHLWSQDQQGRRYSFITNLKRELRTLLRVDGKPLKQIDIANSQLLFLALEMRRSGFACEEFEAVCTNGLLYETIAKRAGTTRSAVKKTITQRALFSGSSAPCQRRKTKRVFDRMYPSAAKFLFDAKAIADGPSKLARTLQFAEADLIINRVCGRLRRSKAIEFVTPVHDSLLFLEHDAETVRDAMITEFANLGVHPQLTVKDV